MKNSKELYADIFDQERDPALIQRTAELEEVYQGIQIPADLTWANLQAKARWSQVHLGGGKMLTFSPWKRRRAGLVAIAAALLLVILAAGGVFALSQEGALDFLFQANSGTQQLLNDNQFTQLQQQWTSNGYKIHLEKGYADANNILLGFMVEAPHGLKQPSKNYQSIVTNLSLHTDQGVSLSEPSENTALDTTETEDLRAGYVFNFDAAAIQGNPDRVKFRLEMETGCSFFDPEPKCTHQTIRTEFSLPFHAGKVITPHQTVKANGTSITLEKVVATASEVRFYLSGGDLRRMGGGNGPAYDAPFYHVDIVKDGQTSYICMLPTGCEIGTQYMGGLDSSSTIQFTGGGFSYRSQGMTSVSVARALDKLHGKVTFLITRYVSHSKRMSDGSYKGGPDVRDEKAQPWAFTLTLP